MQLAATGYRREILHFHCLLERRMLLVLYNGDNAIQNFIWGGILSDIKSKIPFYDLANILS